MRLRAVAFSLQIKAGSGTPNTVSVGSITQEQLKARVTKRRWLPCVSKHK